MLLLQECETYPRGGQPALPRSAWHPVSWASTSLLLALFSSGQMLPKVHPSILKDYIDSP